ncbi:MAG: hypothetical protein U1E53_21440 [Dongiaceae bacterium]
MEPIVADVTVEHAAIAGARVSGQRRLGRNPVERPAAAQRRRPERRGGGRHRGARRGGQRGDQGAALGAGCRAAAPQQEPPAGRERGADRRQAVRRIGEGGGGERLAAELDPARRAVRHDVDGGEVGAAEQRARDLRRHRCATTDQDRLDARPEAAQDLLETGQAGVEKGNFADRRHGGPPALRMSGA